MHILRRKKNITSNLEGLWSSQNTPKQSTSGLSSSFDHQYLLCNVSLQQFFLPDLWLLLLGVIALELLRLWLFCLVHPSLYSPWENAPFLFLMPYTIDLYFLLVYCFIFSSHFHFFQSNQCTVLPYFVLYSVILLVPIEGFPPNFAVGRSYK